MFMGLTLVMGRDRFALYITVLNGSPAIEPFDSSSRRQELLKALNELPRFPCERVDGPPLWTLIQSLRCRAHPDDHLAASLELD